MRNELTFTTDISFTDQEIDAFTLALSAVEVKGTGGEVHTLSVLMKKLLGARANAEEILRSRNKLLR